MWSMKTTMHVTPRLTIFSPCQSVSHRLLQPVGRVAGPGTGCNWTCAHHTVKESEIMWWLHWHTKKLRGSLQLVINMCYIWVDSQQSVCLGEELLLLGDDNYLHILSGLLPNETGHLDENKTPTQYCRIIMHGCSKPLILNTLKIPNKSTVRATVLKLPPNYSPNFYTASNNTFVLLYD